METGLQPELQDQAQRLSTLLNSSEIALVPYSKVGDIWSLSDEFILSIAIQMKEEGTFHKVFYAGTIVSPEEFLEAMQRPSCASVFFFEGTEPLGVAWLNGYYGGMAFVHFGGFRAARGHTKEVGRLALNYWMTAFSFLSLIFGVTPANNKLALRYIESVGMKTLGEIPGVLYDAYAGEKVAAVISYFARES